MLSYYLFLQMLKNYTSKLKNTIIRLIGFFFLILAFSSCKSDCTQKIDTSKINIEPTFVRLEAEYPTMKTKEGAIEFLKRHQHFTSYNLNADKPIEVLINEALWLGNAPMDTLILDVENEFGDFEVEKTALTQLFKNILHYYPEFVVPEVNTIVTGFQGFIMDDTDSLLIIGLDYFLDTNASYLPPNQEIPGYMKRHLVKNNIDTKAAFAFSNRFVQASSDQKLINHMIKYGKQYYFMRQVLPCKTEYQLLDYTPNEWAEIEANDFNIYSYFSKNELFYNSRAENNRLFVGDRPNCVEIGDQCPGRIGRYLGYEIVKAYADKTGVSLREIMDETDHVKIFTQSGYKPKKP